MIQVRAAAGTHTGLVRSRNEDGFGATGIQQSSIDGEVQDCEVTESTFLALVADGLGGHPCGDRASALAIEAILSANPLTPEALTAAICDANEAIYAAMLEDSDCLRMGTTVAALLAHPGGVAVVNVGDSAVFEFDRTRLVQHSTDDVPAGNGRRPGVPTSIVTQTLGGSTKFSPIEPHVHEDDDTTQRRFLVCSDGLTNYLPGDEVRKALTDSAPGVACELLIERALAAGAPDNVTVIVIDVCWEPAAD